MNYCLIVSIINFISCSSLEVIRKEDVTKGREDIDLSDELFVITKDFTKYNFSAFTYQISNDTIYGSGTMESDSLITQFNGSVPLQNVINFQQSKTDTDETIVLITGIITVGLIAFALIALSESSDN